MVNQLELQASEGRSHIHRKQQLTIIKIVVIDFDVSEVCSIYKAKQGHIYCWHDDQKEKQTATKITTTWTYRLWKGHIKLHMLDGFFILKLT